jgi:putative SOS response-associated peptidase YedK
MCYHAAIAATYEQLENHYQRPFEGDSFPSFTNMSDTIGYHLNGFSFPLMPLIGSNKDGVFQNILRAQTLNAKSETAFEKPSFKSSMLNQRCLIPVTGFFEWKQEDSKTKTPYFIHLKNENIFSLAGIYAEWYHEKEDRKYKTFSILTTEANELMHTIHNTKYRMPVIIERNGEKDWLNNTLDTSQVKKLLKPISSHLMEAYTISPLISSRKLSSNVPEVLKPYLYERRDLFS